MLCKVCHITMSLYTVHSSLHVITPLTQNGATSMFIASQHGHSDVVNILIRNGAGVNLACNVWRYNVPYTQYNRRRLSHKAYRSLNVHVCSTLRLVSYDYCRGFIHCHYMEQCHGAMNVNQFERQGCLHTTGSRTVVTSIRSLS